MIDFKPCKKEYISQIIPPETLKEDAQVAYNNPAILQMIDKGVSSSMWVRDTPMAAVGVIPIFPGKRAVVWALVSRHSGPYMLPLLRFMKAFLAEDTTDRLEFLVLEDFKAGHKLARMLGFKCETPEGMKKHSAVGSTEYLYARVK